MRVARISEVSANGTASLTAIGIILIGLVMTGILFWELRQDSQETLENRFQLIAAERTQLVIDRLRENLQDLDTVALFFNSSSLVTREEFGRFVKPIMEDHGFQAVEWIPRVLRQQRAEVESAAQKDGLPAFQFTERDASGAIVRAADREEHFPVYYLEPYAGNESAAGFDLASHPVHLALLDKARDTGQMVATERLSLIQETNGAYGFLVAVPVYMKPTEQLQPRERQRLLRGFVLGVFHSADLVGNALAKTSPRGLQFQLLDLSATHEQQILYTYAPREGPLQPVTDSPLLYHQDFFLADRLWRIEVRPNATFIASNTDRTHLWSILAGSLLTLLAALYLYTLVSQRQRADALVIARTAELQEREQLFRALFEHSGDANLLLDGEHFFDCNQATLKLLGAQTKSQVIHRQPAELSPERQPDGNRSAEKAQELIAATFQEGSKRFEWLHRRLDKTDLWVEVLLTAIPWHGQQILHTTWRDITERKHMEERQRLAAAVFDAAQESIIVTDPKANIVAVNPAFSKLNGYTEEEVLGKNPRLLQSGRQAPSYYVAMWQTLTQDGVWQGEFWNKRKDGMVYTVLATISEVRDASGQLTHYVGMAADITQLKEAEQHIEHLAYYDPLTNLPNRALLSQRAELALAMAARRQTALGVFFLDLDRFKEVNDSLGHAEGDMLLVQVAARLKALTRESDTVCRLGGDEFVLLLSDAGEEGAQQVAHKLLTAFREPFAVAGHRLRITISIGIALYPHDGRDFTELLKNADTALYRAKQEGRNTWLFYDRQMNVATFERLVLEAELRKALESGQLRAYFQPKVRLTDGRLAGAEALVRWQHPDHGLVPPGLFIGVAEASDLIVAIGDWMLQAVCHQLATWREVGLPLPTVAVNLAARHFHIPNLADRVREMLETHGLAPQTLELELTESTLLETGTPSAETLHALRRLGVELAIDDFGTGYSSLGYLKHLPISSLKIDQSFVHDLATDPDDRTIAATIVSLGHSLGLKVVAEGVETEEQRQILLEQGCDFAQGYLFGRPAPAEEFTEWLSSRDGDGKFASASQLTKY